MYEPVRQASLLPICAYRYTENLPTIYVLYVTIHTYCTADALRLFLSL